MEIIKESVLQFEYKIMTYYGLMEEAVTQDILKKKNTSSEDVFNELGKDGWELFTILQCKENCLFIFKRSKWVEKKAQEKQYESALERARIWKDKSGMPKDKHGILDDIFPELAESEGESIREALIKFHKSTIDIDGIKGEDIIAWLEKQGEQKSAWGKEDEDNLTDTCVAIRKFYHGTNGTQELIDWLKSLKDRVQSQLLSQQEWSKDDEELLNCSLSNLRELEQRFGADYGKVGKCIDWLQSLKQKVKGE